MEGAHWCFVPKEASAGNKDPGGARILHGSVFLVGFFFMDSRNEWMNMPSADTLSPFSLMSPRVCPYSSAVQGEPRLVE